jgi:diaminopimelate epimerase
MQKISFAKMSGAGNDFILIDKNTYHNLILSDDSIQRLCDRHNGIGADGIITVSDSRDYDFVMEYFNADGSTGSLCGNGARCAMNFAASRSNLSNKVRFLSNGVEYTGEILSDQKTRFYFNPPENLKMNIKFKAAGQLISADYIDTGSPHVVIDINKIAKDASKPSLCYDDINEVPVYAIGKEIRYLPEFAPVGTNVNFINVRDEKLHIRTYERGVENETLSCGTGSAASALISFFKDELSPPVTLLTYGGDELIVDFKFEDEKIKELSLTGPVKTSFIGEFLLNKYL